MNVIYALVVFKIGEKTTKTPSLFTQNLESLSDAQLVDQTLVITNDPAYKNAEFEISQRDWNKQRQSLVGYESDFRKERIIFTRSVDPSILVGNVEVIYDLLAFCYQTALECSVFKRFNDRLLPEIVPLTDLVFPRTSAFSALVIPLLGQMTWEIRVKDILVPLNGLEKAVNYKI